MPKVNVWRGMVNGPFFFQDATVTSHSDLGMLEHCTVPQLPCDAGFQQDGAHLHFGNTVKSIFKQMLLRKVDWKRWFPAMAPKITRPLQIFKLCDIT
jgi:hypothetical protein